MRRSGVQEWRLDSASTCVDTQHQVGVRQAQSWEERRNDNMEIKVVPEVGQQSHHCCREVATCVS